MTGRRILPLCARIALCLPLVTCSERGGDPAGPDGPESPQGPGGPNGPAAGQLLVVPRTLTLPPQDRYVFQLSFGDEPAQDQLGVGTQRELANRMG